MKMKNLKYADIIIVFLRMVKIEYEGRRYFLIEDLYLFFFVYAKDIFFRLLKVLMSSLMNKFDIEYRIHFLDCQPNSIRRSLNDENVFAHLYRAVAAERIFQFDRTYQREEADRVTDIDQVSVESSPETSSIPDAPPLPPSFDLAIQSEKQKKNAASLSITDSESLWANVCFFSSGNNVAVMFFFVLDSNAKSLEIFR